MDSNGNILSPVEVEQLTETERKRRGLVPIPDEQLSDVQRMNRKQRRAWRVQQRREQRAALAAAKLRR